MQAEFNQKVQECDATMLNAYSNAWLIKTINTLLNDPLNLIRILH